MELVRRYIKRQRSSGFIQTFEYSTYDIIFSEEMRKKDPNFAKLLDFLRLAFETGLPDRPQSPSGMPELLGIEVKQHFQHPLSLMVAGSNYQGAGRNQHTVVQEYFIKNHPDFLAMEVPVWDSEASGCIDILLLKLKPFFIDVFDFKPGARKETKASSQVYRYLKMLIDATGIPAQYFRGFYGDELDTFEVLFNNEQLKNA